MNHRRFIARAALLPLLGTIALVLPAAAAAADLHVTGGSGSCTSQAQGCTLASALSVAHSGDRVLVHAGVYGTTAPTFDNTSATGVLITGAPGEPRPVLDTSSGTLNLTHGTNLQNLDLSSSGGTALRIVGGWVDRVRVSATGTSAVGVELGSGAILRNSAVVASGAWSVGAQVGAGVARATILGSTVVASGDSAAAAQVIPAPGDATSNLRAVNSIFSGAAGALDLRVVSADGQSAAAVLHRCATSADGQSVSGAAASIDQGDSPVTATPLFLDRANGDLREAATSPTIDAGTADADSDGDIDNEDSAVMGPFDLDGDPRRQGIPDIGSDERQLAAAPAATTPAASSGGLSFAPVGGGSGSSAAPKVVTTVRLPGEMPTLISKKSHQHTALFPFRLTCHHSVACRGAAVLTRVGGVRSDAFKIPANQTRTVYFQLTAAQRERVADRGRKGLRGLLELRSLDAGSDWIAVRLFAHAKR